MNESDARTEAHECDGYEAPQVRELGTVHELTAGMPGGPGFPGGGPGWGDPGPGHGPGPGGPGFHNGS